MADEVRQRIASLRSANDPSASDPEWVEDPWSEEPWTADPELPTALVKHDRERPPKDAPIRHLLAYLVHLWWRRLWAKGDST